MMKPINNKGKINFSGVKKQNSFAFMLLLPQAHALIANM